MFKPNGTAGSGAARKLSGLASWIQAQTSVGTWC